jgi:hypothetical protein
MFYFSVGGLSCDGWQPPAIGRGCGLDLPVRVSGFLVPGKSAAQSGTGGVSMDPGRGGYRALGPV